MAPSGHRRNLQPKSSAKSSAEIFIRAVVLGIVSISLVGPNTAVFGIIIVVHTYTVLQLRLSQFGTLSLIV